MPQDTLEPGAGCTWLGSLIFRCVVHGERCRTSRSRGYVTVSACSRHIQESLFLFRDKDLRELGPSKIDCRPDQSMGLEGSKGLLKGTIIQANVAPI
jgi:hypothetical protein